MNHHIKTRLHKKVWEYLQEINNHDYTNPEVQRNIENYGVEVAGIMVKKRLHWVFPGQCISIEHWPKREHGNFDEVKILFENDHCLVLFKPSGIVVQPG
jgi:23S rRNA-/tRNA-specific pseudouridylate synthase